MFGMSFYEIAVIAIVALVILGPDKLPEVARTAGKFLRQVRQLSSTFRDTLMMEADLHEEKQRKKNSGSSAAAALAAAPATTLKPEKLPPPPSHADLYDGYDGPLDQLDDELFHLQPAHDPYVNEEHVTLEDAQMSDPLHTEHVELEPQRPATEQGEDARDAHLANPFDAHLVERDEVALDSRRGVRS